MVRHNIRRGTKWELFGEKATKWSTGALRSAVAVRCVVKSTKKSQLRLGYALVALQARNATKPTKIIVLLKFQ